MVHDAVFAGLGLAGLGQPVDQVHVAGESPGAANAAHRGQAAEVYADADGDVAFLGGLHHLFDLLFVAQVAGVEAQAVHAAPGALQGQLVVEVNVGDEGNVNSLLDFGHCLGCCQVRHGGADDVAAHLFQFVNLADGGLHIAGVGLGHRLDGDFSPAADLDVAHVNRLGNPPLVHRIHPLCGCLKAA